MNAQTFPRRWLAPALAASLWIGFAPAPFSSVSPDTIVALWGHPAQESAVATTTQAQPRAADRTSSASAQQQPASTSSR